jgi:hypothetical protein
LSSFRKLLTPTPPGALALQPKLLLSCAFNDIGVVLMYIGPRGWFFNMDARVRADADVMKPRGSHKATMDMPDTDPADPSDHKGVVHPLLEPGDVRSPDQSVLYAVQELSASDFEPSLASHGRVCH